MVDLIEMTFVVVSRVGPMNHVLDAVQILQGKGLGLAEGVNCWGKWVGAMGLTASTIIIL